MDKIEKITEIILDYMDEYNSNEPNRPMIPRLCAEKVLKTINSLPEEPVSEDLNEAAKDYADLQTEGPYEDIDIEIAFRDGARWQAKQDTIKAIDTINVGKHIRESAGHQVVYLDEVWHDASDVRPERLEPLLIDDGIQFVIGDKTCVEETDKWCYITDILPNKQ